MVKRLGGFLMQLRYAFRILAHFRHTWNPPVFWWMRVNISFSWRVWQAVGFVYTIKYFINKSFLDNNILFSGQNFVLVDQFFFKVFISFTETYVLVHDGIVSSRQESCVYESLMERQELGWFACWIAPVVSLWGLLLQFDVVSKWSWGFSFDRLTDFFFFFFLFFFRV